MVVMSNFRLCLLTFAAAMAAWCSDSALHPARHGVVFERSGVFAGWPANHGIWSWGQEILVGFDAAPFEYRERGHAISRKHAVDQFLARSRDGGETWTIEQPRELATPAGLLYQDFPAGSGPAIQERLPARIDFTRKGFAFTARMTGNPGASRFYYSYDRGKTWAGPYRLPDFGHQGSAARTDYVINSKHDLMLFTTLAKANGREGRVACTRTRDGGRSWTLESYIGPEPAGKPDYAIMPSTLRLGPGLLYTAIRHNSFIDAYRSVDDGKTWKPEGKVAETANPPHLLRLRDGRLVIVYGYRRPAFGIRARVSRDQGATWGEEIILRADGGNNDLGYPRSVERPDGTIVSTYYYNTDPRKERFIGVTLWRPDR